MALGFNYQMSAYPNFAGLGQGGQRFLNIVVDRTTNAEEREQVLDSSSSISGHKILQNTQITD